MSEIKQLVDEWSGHMGQIITAFEGFNSEDRILARAIVSTLRRQLRKLKDRESWDGVKRAFVGLLAKLPTASEGDLIQLFASDAFKRFMDDTGFTMEELEEFDLSELVTELHRFIEAGVVKEIMQGVIELAERCQATFD